MNLEYFPEAYSIYRLSTTVATGAIDELMRRSRKETQTPRFHTLSVTPNEISWIAPHADATEIQASISQDASASIKIQTPFWCLRVAEQMEFDVIGVIAKFSHLMAAAEIPILSISTFETDYFLIPESHRDVASDILRHNGYQLSPIPPNITLPPDA